MTRDCTGRGGDKASGDPYKLTSYAGLTERGAKIACFLFFRRVFNILHQINPVSARLEIVASFFYLWDSQQRQYIQDKSRTRPPAQSQHRSIKHQPTFRRPWAGTKGLNTLGRKIRRAS